MTLHYVEMRIDINDVKERLMMMNGTQVNFEIF